MSAEMHCNRQETLEDYLDGRLEGAAAAAARTHLRHCPEGARAEAARADLDAAFASLPRHDPGPEFTRAVMASVRALPAPAPSSRARLRLSRWELACLAGLYATVALLLLPAAGWLSRAPLGYWWSRAVETAQRPVAAALARLEALAALDWVPSGRLPADAAVVTALVAAVALVLLARLPLSGAPRHPAR